VLVWYCEDHKAHSPFNSSLKRRNINAPPHLILNYALTACFYILLLFARNLTAGLHEGEVCPIPLEPQEYPS
jgi:hypothetical protein